MKTAFLTALTLTACAVWAQEATVPADPPAAAELRFGSLTLGEKAPDFTVVGEKGANATLSGLQGGRTTIVHFFTGARPQPYLDKIAKTYGKSLTVVAVSMAAERKDFDAWLAAGKSGVSYPVGWDPAGKGPESIARKQFGIGMFPATVVIDGAGKLVDGTIGFGAMAETKVFFALDRAGVPLLAADKPKAAPPAVVKASDAPRPASRPALLAAGTEAPDFTMQDIDGKDVKISDFKGKVVVLDFWAPWCGPCRALMPHLEEVHQATKEQGVVVLASCTSDTRENYEKFVADNSERYSFLFTHDANGKTPDSASKKLYNVSGIPTQYIIGRDGVIIDAIVGGNKKRLADALTKAGINVPHEEPAQAAQN